MPVLNKESLFNKLTKDYPKATELFLSWIDQYKSEIKWNKLFSYLENDKQIIASAEFHEIPFEMQIGIIIKFFRVIAEDNTYPNFFNYLPVNELVDNFDIYTIRGFNRLEIIIAGNSQS